MESKGLTVSRDEFYQSKYDYYLRFNFWVVVVGALSSLTYFISDCIIFGHFQTQTLFSRFFVLLPLIAFIISAKKVKNYRVMVVFSYIIIHVIMWDTIFAIRFLPDKSHASEGFIIMQLLFFALGFASPFRISLPFHIAIFADILISNTFNHYENLDMMLSLGIPATAGILVTHFFIQYYYMDHFKTVKNLEHLSQYDQLTETYNRNRINQITDSDHMSFKKEYGEQITVMMMDIDFFKKVNDQYGHIAGDTILKKVCLCIKENLPEKSDFIRWGGEEFVIVIPNFPVSQGIFLAEELVSDVAKMDNGVCPITISIGISGYNGESYKDAIDAADRALYIAKECGRNCVKYVN